MTTFMPDQNRPVDVFPEGLHTALRGNFGPMPRLVVALAVVPTWDRSQVFCEDDIYQVLDVVTPSAIESGLQDLVDESMIQHLPRHGELRCNTDEDAAVVQWAAMSALRTSIEHRFKIDLPSL